MMQLGTEDLIGRVILSASYLAMTVWLFRPLPGRRGARQVAGTALLLGLVYLFFSPPDPAVVGLRRFLSQLARGLYHWAVVAGYLCVSKRISLEAGWYNAGFLTGIYLCVQGLRIAMFLIDFSAQANVRASLTYGVIVVEFLVILLVRRLVHFPQKSGIGLGRWGILVLCVSIEFVLRGELIYLDGMFRTDATGIIVTSFAFLAAFGVLAVQVLFETTLWIQTRKTELELSQVTLGYEMQNAKRAMQTNYDMRRLYHDMKNHLLAIESMAGEQAELQRYLQQLLPQFDGYETQVSTGNAVVDALLSEKMQRARLDGIRFQVCLDLSPLKHVENIDLVTIFGNAVDNAIEACQLLPNRDERAVHLKSSGFANTVVLRFSNRYTGRLHQKNGRLMTGKSNADLHGIGLESIRKTLARYGGSMDIRYEGSDWFELSVMLPLADAGAPDTCAPKPDTYAKNLP